MRHAKLSAQRLWFDALASGMLALQLAAQTSAPAEKLFPTPEAATEALKAAAAWADQSALNSIFGPDRQKLLSGDAVEDQRALAHFAAELARSSELKQLSDSKYTLLTGNDHWPFPVPIVRWKPSVALRYGGRNRRDPESQDRRE